MKKSKRIGRGKGSSEQRALSASKAQVRKTKVKVDEPKEMVMTSYGLKPLRRILHGKELSDLKYKTRDKQKYVCQHCNYAVWLDLADSSNGGKFHCINCGSSFLTDKKGNVIPETDFPPPGAKADKVEEKKEDEDEDEDEEEDEDDDL